MILNTEKEIIFSYFFTVIAIGTILLILPVSWTGPEPLSLIDAFFTSVSAACVTGLITVDTALYSRFGQLVIALLIQFGGLGIISFSSLYVVIPSKGMSLKGSRLVREYYLDSVEYEPEDIIKQIILFTTLIELSGMILLYLVFRNTEIKNPLFVSFFHSVSAFCNAGFSTFTNNLENYKTNIIINFTVILLIISGGAGFVLLRDIIKTYSLKKRHLAIHTKIVILMTLLLIIISAAIFLFAEKDNMYSGMGLKDSILISLFNAVTPRTAGFNTVPINELSLVSKLTILPLMFIGAAPGSIGGGIKVTTFFIVLIVIFKKMDINKNIVVFRRNIKSETIFKAFIFIIKALFILFFFIFLLTLSEYYIANNNDISLFDIIFECFSAFGTVGLSLGITGNLSLFGKIVIISTMLYGRFGLLIMAMDIFKTSGIKGVDYPDEEVLIG